MYITFKQTPMKKITKNLTKDSIKDFIEDIVWNVEDAWDSVCEFIRKWYDAITIKERRDIIKAVVDGHPWDYSYLLDLERAHLKYMRKYFKTSQISYSAQDSYEKINWAINILDLLIDDHDLDEIINTGEKYECGLPKIIVKCKKYVNFRNVDRFIEPRSYDPGYVDAMKKLYKDCPSELYREKLWNLYWLIRKRYTKNWWD